MEKFLPVYEICGVLTDEISRVCREHKGLPGEWPTSKAREWTFQIEGMINGIYYAVRQNQETSTMNEDNENNSCEDRCLTCDYYESCQEAGYCLCLDQETIKGVYYLGSIRPLEYYKCIVHGVNAVLDIQYKILDCSYAGIVYKNI